MSGNDDLELSENARIALLLVVVLVALVFGYAIFASVLS